MRISKWLGIASLVGASVLAIWTESQLLRKSMIEQERHASYEGESFIMNFIANTFINSSGEVSRIDQKALPDGKIATYFGFLGQNLDFVVCVDSGTSNRLYAQLEDAERIESVVKVIYDTHKINFYKPEVILFNDTSFNFNPELFLESRINSLYGKK